MVNMETFGGRVQALRTEKGIGLRALARQAGVAPSFMVGIEDGSRMPSPGKLGRIAAALGVPEAELQVLDPRVLEGREALRLALMGDRAELEDYLECLEDGYLERLAEGAAVLQAAAGEVLGRRHG